MAGELLYNVSVPPPDELRTEIQQYVEDSETTIQEIAVRTALSFIPFAGSAILELANGLAQRRAQARLNTVFEQMKIRLEEIERGKIDEAYFHSEEFQSVLYLLLERLHSTHHAEKIRMFGNALANAGCTDFQEDPKEEFVRVLRDLSINDLNVLNHENLRGWRPHLPRVHISYSAEVLVSLFRLQGMGLVLAALAPREAQPGRTGNTRLDTMHTVSDLLTQPPRTTYYLSEFGDRFLRFIAAEGSSNTRPTAS